MSKFSRALAATVLAATLPATVVLAQQAGAPEQSGAEQTEKHRGPSADTLARLQDGRIAMIKAALRLTPEQEKLWAPVEDKMRAGFAERQKKRDEWQAKRQERHEARGEEKQKLALPDRIEARSQRMTEMAAKLTERAAKTKEYAETLKPLFASFTDDQKEVAGRVLAQGHRGHGRHFAMGGPDGGRDGGKGGHRHEKRWE
jgi:LTXXQ motif family protein